MFRKFRERLQRQRVEIQKRDEDPPPYDEAQKLLDRQIEKRSVYGKEAGYTYEDIHVEYRSQASHFRTETSS